MVEPPPAIYVPPTPGGPVTAPPAVFAPGGSSYTSVLLAGTSNNSAGPLGDRGDPDLDGRHRYTGATSEIYWSGGNWVILSAGYGAFKASTAMSPVGLTGWTITTGTGQPTITAGVLSPPPAIKN